MALTINTNINSLSAQRHLSTQDATRSRALERMASGLRVNSAKDDAAGLAIASRMASRITGLDQSKRNLNDATSLLQVADGAMAQVTESLQQLRSLAVEAGNKTLSPGDISALQQQAGQILAGITQVSQQSSFNGQAVFSQDTQSLGGDKAQRAVIDHLKTGWLTSAENLIKQYYGLSGDGATLTVDLTSLHDGQWNVLAQVAGTVYSGSDKVYNQQLQLDMADFPDINEPDGGVGPMFDDRVIAHEMVHAVFGRATSNDAPTWFKEGTAELIHGADERLAAALSPTNTSSDIANGVTSSSFTYEGAYAATRYMHDQLKKMGVTDGIKAVMVYMNQNQTASLDDALDALTSHTWTTADDFLADFHTAGHGDTFIDGMNLANADTGAIGGLDADNGPVRTATDIVADSSDRNPDAPLAGFKVILPTLGGTTATKGMQVQVGANAGETIDLSLAAMNAAALGLDDLDLSNASIALLHIDQALDFVSQQRVNAGASLNRLDIAARNSETEGESLTSARSRILDTDYAAETVVLTRTQILQQAASAMITQANSMPSGVLALLR